MEFITPYIGKYDGCSVFLNHGKYGPYLNYKDGLYSVPQCFQKPKFKLDDAIKIIEYKKKMREQQIENKKDFKDDEPTGTTDDPDDDIIQKIKNRKNKKESKTNI